MRIRRERAVLQHSSWSAICFPVERIMFFPSRHLFDRLSRLSCGVVLLSPHIVNVIHGESLFRYVPFCERGVDVCNRYTECFDVPELQVNQVAFHVLSHAIHLFSNRLLSHPDAKLRSFDVNGSIVGLFTCKDMCFPLCHVPSSCHSPLSPFSSLAFTLQALS